MVSSIVPGASNASTLQIEPRASRANTSSAGAAQNQAEAADRVELSAASLAAVRESVRAAGADLRLTLAVGQEAQAFLVNVQALARGGGSQADLDAALEAFARRVDAAAADGARLLVGEDALVQAEPGAAPLVIEGADLRLKAQPGFSDIIAVPADARIDDPKLAAAAQRSLDNLQEALTRLSDAARALDAHQGFLGAAAEVAGKVRADLDSDGARLLALQVRQGLEAARGAIANAEPQAVLALFKSA